MIKLKSIIKEINEAGNSVNISKMEELAALQYINNVIVKESVQDWNKNKSHYLPRTTVEEVRNNIRKKRVDKDLDGRPYISYQALYLGGSRKPICFQRMG